MKQEDDHADLDIITKLKNNEEEAMLMLYKLYWKKLFISAYKILKDKEACEDIIQDLFIRIWDNRNKINITSSIQGYLFASIRFAVFRTIRESNKFEPIVQEMAFAVTLSDSYHCLENKELQNQISSVVNMLPPKCKEVYKMSRDEALSHKEIAYKLDISTKTVRNHITKALNKLRLSIGHMTN